MSENYFKRTPVTDLYPPFAEKVQTLQSNCLARGVAYYGISGYRSVAEQEGLYQLGRSVRNPDGASDEKPLGNIVTKVRGGKSYHNWRIAIDFCTDKDVTRAGLQPDYRESTYIILAEEAVRVGLEPGGLWTGFKDWPHIQLPLSRVGLDLAALAVAHARGGDAAVLNLLNRYSW